MIYYISLGANLGEREQTIRQAISLLNSEVGRVLAQSSFHYSPAWGFESQHEFCNCCLKLTSTLSPSRVLYITQDIEKALGRSENSHRVNENGKVTYADREIDIDLLMAFDMPADSKDFPMFPVSVHTKTLTLPHPKMDERDFVKIPLSEIFPFS